MNEQDALEEAELKIVALRAQRDAANIKVMELVAKESKAAYEAAVKAKEPIK